MTGAHLDAARDVLRSMIETEIMSNYWYGDYPDVGDNAIAELPSDLSL